MNSALLKDLLDLGDAFEQAHPDPTTQTLPDFMAWVAQQRAGIGAPAAVLPPAPAPEPEYRYYDSTVPVLQTYVAHIITNSYRYFRGYVKKVFESVPLLNFDDYITLAILAGGGSLTKTRLVELTINEKTSGMLAIKRLLDNGFVIQTDDEQDKRTRRIAITPEGLAKLRAAQPVMDQATSLFKGDLTEDEQRQLSALLSRLDKFHEPIYLAHLKNRDLPLNALKAAGSLSNATPTKVS